MLHVIGSMFALSQKTTFFYDRSVSNRKKRYQVTEFPINSIP